MAKPITVVTLVIERVGTEARNGTFSCKEIELPVSASFCVLGVSENAHTN